MESSISTKAALAIRDAFVLFQAEFKKTTRRARACFETRDWHGQLRNSADRLDIYNRIVLVVAAEVRTLLHERVMDKRIWRQMKGTYSALIRSRPDVELAETFFNSTTRRIFTTVGVDPEIEFVSSDFGSLSFEAGPPIYRTYSPTAGLPDLICRVVNDVGFQAPFRSLKADAAQAAKLIDCHLQEAWGSGEIEAADFLIEPFFRSKGAYLVGRLRRGAASNPIALSLWNDADGIYIDAVLLTEDEVSILFSFARSYFLVVTERPHELVAFLKELLPLKRLAELYISIGYNKHGKTELYRDLLAFLKRSGDRFDFTPGQRGMVMIVFALPSYDMVFKVIRDRYPDPKRTSRAGVMDRYQLVFKHDRAGRLVDAQEFEHLSFEKSRFAPALLDELLREAPSVVSVENDRVDIKHVYTERRLTPLDVYIRKMPFEAARDAVLDYGDAIKDLAATNVFPGDILLKNFGVTRHGRVVFYDYDELSLLSACKFRRLPQARTFSDEFEADPWFYVGDADVFPAEFETFLGLEGGLREAFQAVHADLFDVDFWKRLQKHHAEGVVVDIFPYKQSRRLVG